MEGGREGGREDGGARRGWTENDGNVAASVL